VFLTDSLNSLVCGLFKSSPKKVGCNFGRLTDGNEKGFAMQDTGKMVCPICTKELLQPTFLCFHCGSDLHGMKPARRNPKASPYEIVPDGSKFGITLRGEIKIHGLELKNAQSLISILNS